MLQGHALFGGDGIGQLAQAARETGFDIMLGCMLCTSRAIRAALPLTAGAVAFHLGERRARDLETGPRRISRNRLAERPEAGTAGRGFARVLGHVIPVAQQAGNAAGLQLHLLSALDHRRLGWRLGGGLGRAGYQQSGRCGGDRDLHRQVSCKASVLPVKV